MIRTLLRLLNGPILLLLSAFGVAIQSSLFGWWPLNFLQPDVVLILVIWCALKRNFEEGGIVTLLAAEMAELHSSTPSGVFMIAYMGVYLTVRVAARFLVIPSLAALASITLASAVGWRILVMLSLYLLGAGMTPLHHIFLYLFLGAAVEALLGFWLFRWIEKFDGLTHKNQRADQLVDELQLDSEGF